MTKNVRVQYFAILREQRGLGAETVSTAADTAGELYEELRVRHGFSLPAARLRAAVNDEFSPWTAVLKEGDLLVFIPPVAGG
jgi:sulfur-carrier protein